MTVLWRGPTKESSASAIALRRLASASSQSLSPSSLHSAPAGFVSSSITVGKGEPRYGLSHAAALSTDGRRTSAQRRLPGDWAL